MLRARVLGAAVLAGSLGANAYLLATRGRDVPPEAAPSSRSVKTAKRPANPGRAAQANVKPVDDELLPVPPDVAALDRAALEKRLADAESRIDGRLPFEERFAKRKRRPENELRLQPFLDRAFGVKPGDEPPYDIECRDELCLIQADDSTVDWQRAVQDAPDHEGLYFPMGGGPQSLIVKVVGTPESAAGIRFIVQFARAVQDSGAVAACKTANPSPGVLQLVLRVDSPGRATLTIGGALAGEPGGECIRKAAEDLLAATPLPPEVTALPEVPIPVTVP